MFRTSPGPSSRGTTCYMRHLLLLILKQVFFNYKRVYRQICKIKDYAYRQAINFDTILA